MPTWHFCGVSIHCSLLDVHHYPRRREAVWELEVQPLTPHTNKSRTQCMLVEVDLWVKEKTFHRLT